VRFFIDNNLAPQLATGMSAFGENVTHLTDHFPHNTLDEIWLEYIGKNDLYLITRDEAIRRNPMEIKAIRAFSVGAFFLGGKNRTRCQLIQQLVSNWPRIKKFAAKTKKPFAFRIPPSGTKFVKIPLS